MLSVLVKKLPNFKGDLPTYQTADSSGMDIKAMLNTQILLRAGTHILIPTGLAMTAPKGYEIQVRSRSGLAAKNGVMVLNSPGTIDRDYTGEIKVILANLSDEDFVVNPGDRIAQLVVAPVIQVTLQMAEDLASTNRGEGGFGSTGLK